MTPSLDAWKPVSVGELPSLLGPFSNWFLCGGESVDHLVGRTTRDHGDIDVGVYRSELTHCLQCVRRAQGIPYLCDPPGSVRCWMGEEVPAHVNDIFVADQSETCWRFQILVYSDDGDEVIFKRNDALRWSKSAHVIEHQGIRMLNPAVTLLYKATNGRSAAKDLADIRCLIESAAMYAPGDVES